MGKTDVKRLTAAIGKLSATELSAVRKAVARREGKVQAEVVETEMVEAVRECPHCGGKKLKSAGSKGGRKRFKCRACAKTFNGFTGTPLAGLHNQARFIDHARHMIEGDSVRKTADALGMAVTTAFRWRHRFLQVLQERQPVRLQGVVEADETYFLESFKGQRNGLPRKAKKRGSPAKKRGLSKEQIPVLVARDRTSGRTLTVVLPSRKGKDIAAALAGRLPRDTVLVTDGATAYREVSRVRQGVEIRTVRLHAKKKTVGPSHINNVNAYDARLKGWMFRFKGVSTKRLPAYLGWHRWLDSVKGRAKSRRFLADAAGL